VVAVAGGRPVGFTVDVVVGDGDTVVSFSAQDVVLTTNASSLDDSLVYIIAGKG
jgi:ribosomal protein S5